MIRRKLREEYNETPMYEFCSIKIDELYDYFYKILREKLHTDNNIYYYKNKPIGKFEINIDEEFTNYGEIKIYCVIEDMDGNIIKEESYQNVIGDSVEHFANCIKFDIEHSLQMNLYETNPEAFREHYRR